MPQFVVRHAVPVVFLAVLLNIGPALAEPPPTYLSEWYGTKTPEILVTDGSGNLLVTDHGHAQIGSVQGVYRYSASGVLLGHWGGTFGSGPGQFYNPTGIAVGPGGDIYVCDTGNHRVQRFSSAGAFLGSWGQQGTIPAYFLDPRGVATDASGQVYVSDHLSRIQVFSATGAFVREFAIGTIANALAIDPSGSLFVAGWYQMLKYSLDGTLQTQWGVEGDGPGQFAGLVAVALDPSGNVYVTDRFNGRVQKFTSNGGYLSQFGSFGSPSGLAVLPGGDLVVSGLTGRYQRFRPCSNCPGNDSTGRPKLVLHLGLATQTNPCAAGYLGDCATAVTRGSVAGPNGPWYNLYLLVVPRSLASLAGVQFGIAFQEGRPTAVGDVEGLDIFSWRHCATLEFTTTTPQWPAPGAGNMITWDADLNCQSVVHSAIVAGYWYVGAYSADRFWLTRHPGTNGIAVVDCASVQTAVDARELGAVAFSPGAVLAGCNPCLTAGCQPEPPVSVQHRTWSSIKAFFHDRN